MLHKKIAFGSIIMLILIEACTYNKGPVVPAKDCTIVIPDTVSFSRDIIPLFAQHCSTSGCHSGSSPEGNLNLESSKAYAQLNKNGSGYINTSNPRNSVLYISLVSTSDPMPPNGGLPDCSVDLILKWMSQHAPNN